MTGKLRARLARLWRVVKWPVIVGAAGLALLLIPVGYVELACRGSSREDAYQPSIADPFRRVEANTYLTYPEWHIVYAYDGLAEALKHGDEYQFDYVRSVRGFWTSTCALMQVADAHGGADFGTRSMIHTIGVSFTAEMAAKAAYEETIGRVFAWLRGATKTPQDRVIAEMAADYSAFLRQTPWYEYPFLREAGQLWSTPTEWTIRGWERRLGIGFEFVSKAVYAKVLGAAAGAAPAALTIRSVVSDISETDLAQLQDVTIRGAVRNGIEIETPRYARFTAILVAIARRGGAIQEIAGNDDIMVTITAPEGDTTAIPQGATIFRLRRDGFPSDRLMIDIKVPQLAALLRELPLADPGVEHVFDY